MCSSDLVLKLIDASGTTHELDARPSDAIALALRTDTSIWMLEEVVGDASIPVDAEADAVDQEDFRRFLERTSPAELIRHLGKAIPEQPGGEEAETEGSDGEPVPPGGGESAGDVPPPPQATGQDTPPASSSEPGPEAEPGQEPGAAEPGPGEEPSAGPHAGA